jgi:hypothetical protein
VPAPRPPPCPLWCQVPRTWSARARRSCRLFRRPRTPPVLFAADPLPKSFRRSQSPLFYMTQRNVRHFSHPLNRSKSARCGGAKSPVPTSATFSAVVFSASAPRERDAETLPALRVPRREWSRDAAGRCRKSAACARECHGSLAAALPGSMNSSVRSRPGPRATGRRKCPASASSTSDSERAALAGLRRTTRPRGAKTRSRNYAGSRAA